MRSQLLPLLAAATCLAGNAFAEGDPASGEKDFKRCRACHTIASADEVIYKGGRTGPNLYDIFGKPAASVEGYKYAASIKQAGEAGLIWTEENLLAYIADPRGFLKEFTGDPSAKAKMTFKMKGAEDVIAYLISVAPPAE